MFKSATVLRPDTAGTTAGSVGEHSTRSGSRAAQHRSAGDCGHIERASESRDKDILRQRLRRCFFRYGEYNARLQTAPLERTIDGGDSRARCWCTSCQRFCQRRSQRGRASAACGSGSQVCCVAMCWVRFSAPFHMTGGASARPQTGRRIRLAGCARIRHALVPHIPCWRVEFRILEQPSQTWAPAVDCSLSPLYHCTTGVQKSPCMLLDPKQPITIGSCCTSYDHTGSSTGYMHGSIQVTQHQVLLRCRMLMCPYGVMWSCSRVSSME